MDVHLNLKYMMSIFFNVAKAEAVLELKVWSANEPLSDLWMSEIQGVKSVMNLGLAGSINTVISKPAYYVRRQSIGRQLLFDWDKTKQNLHGNTGWHISNNLNGIKHYTIHGFNMAGKMVFTTELASRVVDSQAWIYKANKTTMIFKARDYRRVIY
ncbi:hypothetical protein F5146DRAFT_1004012 [Armillaria mellea]|nr:hypothetical protein F5146DRAFT_1004012 [Armillaria mellea]